MSPGIDQRPGTTAAGARPPSVLHVVRSTRRRGAETFAHHLSSALAARGLTSRTVALTGSDADHPLPVPVLGARPLGPGTLLGLRQAARPVDVVVAHGSRTLDACALALTGTGTPFAYRSIGDPGAWSSRGVRRLRTAVLLGRAAGVAVLWPGAASTLRRAHGVPAAKVRVIPNGVPVADHPVPDATARAVARSRLGLPADAPVAACIGALSPEKRVPVAVDAVAALPEAHLLVVGDGPERPAVEARAAQVAPGRVHCVGVLPGSAEALAAADAVVSVSRTEGMPGVLIEAGLAARPCVATAVGGVPAVVEDGVTGVLVPPDDLAALTDALGTVLADVGTAGRMGAAARRRCTELFDMATVTAQWADFLTALVAPTSR